MLMILRMAELHGIDLVHEGWPADRLPWFDYWEFGYCLAMGLL